MHELNETLNLLKNLEKKDFISSDKIHNNILNFKNHNLEIKNWLNFILKN